MDEIDYERGVIQLQNIVKRHAPNRLGEFEVLAFRLAEVLDEEKRYGSNDNTQSQKSRVVDILATFTQEVVGTEEIHFLNLCQPHRTHRTTLPTIEKQPTPSPFSQHKEQWSGGTEIMIQDALYLLYDPPRIEEIWSPDHGVVRRRAKAQQLSSKRIMWLKQVHVQQQSTTAKAWYDALEKEGRLLEQLEDEQHQYFPRLLTLNSTPQSITLSYVFIVGNSLMQTFGPFDKPLEAYRISPLLQSMYTLCTMLDVLHSKHFSHRMLTPENILLVGGRNAVLQDIGHATQSFLLGENPSPYQAPEQLRLTRDIAIPGPQTDIYQLGALLYHILTGQLLSSSQDIAPSIWNDAISQELDAVLMKAIAPLTKDRWRTIRDFSKALKHVVVQTSYTR